MTPTLASPIQATPLSPLASIDAHVARAHRCLGGQIEDVGPLRLYVNPRYGWTFFNCARQVTSISDGEIEGLIRRVVRYYNTRGARPAWEVSATRAPRLLPARLAALGFALDRDETLLIRPLAADRGRPPALPPGVRLTPIGESGLDLFVSAWRQGFAVGADTDLARVRALFADDLASGWEFWSACRDGQPIGTIAGLSLDGVTQIANVSTVPSERGRGVASALITYVTARAATRGGTLIYLHAATASAAEGLYRGLGFTPLEQTLTYIHDSGGH